MSPPKYNQKEFAKFQAENLMNQLQESVRIVNTTSNARAFFGRLKFSLEVLSELQKYEKYRFFKNSSPTDDYNKIISNLEATVDNFIDRAIEENKKKLNGYKTDAAKSRNYKKFVEDLLDDFEMADTFWSGNNMYPPYKGILYTSANYQRVKKMYDDLFIMEATQPKHAPVNNVVYQNVHNDSLVKYGGVEAELMTIDLMEGHDFERWCAGALKETGFSMIEVTPASGDHGVDVLAQKDGIKYAIQCKRYSHDLGNTPVQEVHAGKAMYNCHVGVVLTNQHFTAGAKQLAQATGVLLWDREWIKEFLKSRENKDNTAKLPDNAPNEDADELFDAAVSAVVETGQASISMIQRRLNIGYAQAARIVDEMEKRGIVGPFRGSQPREIYIETKEKLENSNSISVKSSGDTYTVTLPAEMIKHSINIPQKVSTSDEEPSFREKMIELSRRVGLSLLSLLDFFLFFMGIGTLFFDAPQSNLEIIGLIILLFFIFIFSPVFSIWILFKKKEKGAIFNKFAFWFVFFIADVILLSFSYL